MWKPYAGVRSEPVRNPIEQGAVRRFAESIGDPSPLFRDTEVARNSRWGRPIAPPTFARTLDLGSIPGLPYPKAGMIHGEQGFTYERPLFVGEEVRCWTALRDAYEKQSRNGTLTFLVFEGVGEDADGERIFTQDAVLIVTETVKASLQS